MDIQISKAATEFALQDIRDLYLSAFPANERRSYEGFRQQFLHKESCSIFMAEREGENLGFFTLWDFNSFAFIEHLAVWPAFRGRKIGEDMLRWIAETYKKPILLEAEPPLDEMSRRRVAFYRRNGFHTLEYEYHQPSYDGITPGPLLIIMSSVPVPAITNLESWIERIKKEVYAGWESAS